MAHKKWHIGLHAANDAANWLDRHCARCNFLYCRPIRYCTLCSEKNTHSHFLSYLHEWCV